MYFSPADSMTWKRCSKVVRTLAGNYCQALWVKCCIVTRDQWEGNFHFSIWSLSGIYYKQIRFKISRLPFTTRITDYVNWKRLLFSISSPFSKGKNQLHHCQPVAILPIWNLQGGRDPLFSSPSVQLKSARNAMEGLTFEASFKIPQDTTSHWINRPM